MRVTRDCLNSELFDPVAMVMVLFAPPPSATTTIMEVFRYRKAEHADERGDVGWLFRDETSSAPPAMR